MARRGFLDYVLGGAVGGLEGLAQKRAAEEERKRMADAAAMDQARLLMQLNYRVAPEAYDTEDPAARSILPPLEMPSASAPPPAARASGALSAALNRGMGVDTTQPSLSRPSFGAKPLAMDIGGSSMTKMFESAKQTRAAQEPIAASVNLPGGQKVRFNAPESAAQLTARKLADYEAQKKADAAIAAQAKADERKALAAEKDQLVEKYRLLGFNNKDATIFAENSAAFTAMRGQDKTEETARLNLASSNSKANRDYDLRKKEFERREADSILRRERLPSGAQTKLAGLDSGALMVGDVRAMLEQNMGAIGPIKGRMFRSILDANDKEGVGTRAAIEALSGEIRNQRFGQALTAKEAKYAESMLPTEKDAAETAFKKLEQLENYLERKREGIFRVYKQPYERVNTVSGIKEW
jgi:hypothetical protein